jgi:hypothetical protein
LGQFHEIELPGECEVLKGLADLAAGIESLEGLLVAIGAPRLRACGIFVPKVNYTEFPEERFYRFLQRESGDEAHSRMNAYVRLLVSFESALEMLVGK